jgi:hypothetical protein
MPWELAMNCFQSVRPVLFAIIVISASHHANAKDDTGALAARDNILIKDANLSNASPQVQHYAQSAAQSCDDLWFQRNSIFRGAGYCFKTPRAIRTFGNAGCQYDNEADVPLSDRQRATINRIKSLEASKGCAG